MPGRKPDEGTEAELGSMREELGDVLQRKVVDRRHERHPRDRRRDPLNMEQFGADATRQDGQLDRNSEIRRPRPEVVDRCTGRSRPHRTFINECNRLDVGPGGEGVRQVHNIRLVAGLPPTDNVGVEHDPDRPRLYHRSHPLSHGAIAAVRIAILGIRGVPANYGGFETFAEQLGSRLAARGHAVTVYGRDAYAVRDLHIHRGMRLVRLPAPRSKYLETVIHSLFAAIHAIGGRYDIVYVCNLANVPAVIVLRALGRRVVLNVDGLEWQRAKWNGVGKAYYRLCAWLAAKLPVKLVTDARVIQDHYLRAYGRATDYFPYGTDLDPVPDDGTLERVGLEPGRYVLYVSRLEPENNAHVVVEAYASVQSELPLAIVGDAPYADEYIARLHATSDPRVRFLGAIYGMGYHVLRSHATAYVQATEVGGTHPALVEAMGFGNAIVANDVPEHRETLGDAGRYYRGAEALASELQAVLDDPDLARELRRQAHERAASVYDWDAIADAYEAWLTGLVGH